MKKLFLLTLITALAMACFGMSGCATTGQSYAKASAERPAVDANSYRHNNELCGFCGGWPF